MCLFVGSSKPTNNGVPIGSGRDDNSSDDSNAAVIGAVVGVSLIVIIVFCTVLVLLVVLYLNNRRIQGQQQWQKDPEFQVYKHNCMPESYSCIF